MKKIGKSFQLFLEDIYHFLNNRGVLNAYIPRWIVLFLDMFCITAAYAFMIILFKTLISNHINSGILNRYAVIMIVFFAMEFCFKIYRGTIRYSGLSEITRLFLYIMTSTALTALTLHYLSTSSSLYYISNIWLIIHAAGAFFLMFLTRIFIRYGHYFF